MDKKAKYALITSLIIVVVIEACSYFSLRLLNERGFAISQFPPEGYLDYLAIRDPVLGWPPPSRFGTDDRDKTGARRQPNYPEPSPTACVHTFGDSFTWGDEVDAEHTYPAVLAGLLRCRVANFGIGGYGTDQALLRYQHLDRSHAPVVILGHYAENIVRNVNQYRGFIAGPTLKLKPRFIEDQSGSLQLIPIPKLTLEEYRTLYTNPSEILPYEYFDPNKLGNSPFISFPYTIALARIFFHYRLIARVMKRPPFEPFYDPEHASNAFSITKLIVRQFVKTARTRNQIPVFIIIPDKADLDLVRSGQAATYAQFAQELRQEGIDSPDIARAMVEYLGTRQTCEIYTSCIRNSHFNPEGYELLATIVHQWLAQDEEIMQRLGTQIVGN